MSSHLYRSTGGAMRFYTQSGAGKFDDIKKLATKKVGPLPLWVWSLIGLAVLIIIILLIADPAKVLHRKEGFIPGGQTGSGFGGTFTQHRSQHAPRNRTVDDLEQLGEMGNDTGAIATGQPSGSGGCSSRERWSDLQDSLEEDFDVVGDDDVPDDRSIIPIPTSGQSNPEPFAAGRAEFFDDLAANNTNWLEARLRKKQERFMNASKGRGRAPSALPNESNMGFIHILPEDDYGTSGVSADQPDGQGASFLNPRTMGQSHRPHSQRLVEGFGSLAGGCGPGEEWNPMAGACVPEEFADTAYDELIGEGFATPQECVGPNGQPLTALQRQVLGCPQQEGMGTGYGYAMLPSSFQRRNMISGQPDKKARQVVHNFCKKQGKGECKTKALCDWNHNRKSCMPAKRPANECVFPLNPKYKPTDTKTGDKVMLPANACIDTTGSNFNKWVETDWVLKYDKPYASMKQSDMYYKQLQKVAYHNPCAWDIKKPKDTKTSMEPGAVQEFARERRDPVGVDDSELLVDGLKAAKAARKEMVRESAQAAAEQRAAKKEGFLGWLLG